MAARAGNPVLERWNRKLRNWALWYAGSQSTAGGSAYDENFGGAQTRPPPPLVGEAVDTDALVIQLTHDHIAAVRAYYVWSGALTENAVELGITLDCLSDRVTAAKFRLEHLDQLRRRDMVRPPKQPA